MFGINMWELVLILVVALIALGPKQLTETAKVVGKIYRELQKMTWDLRNSIDLDSSSSSTHRSEASNVRDNTYNKPPEFTGLPGDKSGPDFYAELLEKSLEEEKKVEGSTSSAADEKQQDSGAAEPEKKEEKSAVGKP